MFSKFLSTLCLVVALLTGAQADGLYPNGVAGGLNSGVRQSAAPSWVSAPSGKTASIFLDFTTGGTTNHYWGNGAQLPLSSFVSTSRASPALTYAAKADGTLQSFAANVPRITDLGLLVEESRTNLLTYSEQFDQNTASAWTPAASGGGSVPVITANQGTAPNGALTADKVVFAAPSGSDESSFTQPIPTTPSSNYSGSFYVKAFAAGDIGKVLNFRVADGPYQLVTLTASWQRVTYTQTASLSLYYFLIGLVPLNGGSTGTVSVLIWGAQAELGSFPTSYIPTTSAAVTRDADVITGIGATVTGTAAYSVLAQFGPIQLAALGGGVVSVNGSNFIGAAGSPSTGGEVYTNNGAHGVSATLGTGNITSSSVLAACGGDASSVSIVGNGGTVVPMAFGFGPTMSSINLGQFGNLNGFIQRIAVWNSRLSDATLQGLTQ